MKYNFKALPTDPWEGVKIAADMPPEMGEMDEAGGDDLDDLFAGDNLTIGSKSGLWYDTVRDAGESEVAMDLLGLGQNVGDTYNTQAALDREAAVQRKAPMLVNPTNDPWGGLKPESDPTLEDEDSPYGRMPKKWTDPEEDWVPPPRDPNYNPRDPKWTSPLERPGYVPASQKKAVFPTFNDPGEMGDEEESEYPMSDDPTMTERWDKPDLGGGYDEYEYEDRLNEMEQDDDSWDNTTEDTSRPPLEEDIWRDGDDRYSSKLAKK